MPSQYPTSLDTTTTLSSAVNFVSTLLSGDHPSSGNISVASTTGFPSFGYIVIDNEVIRYLSTTSSSFTGVTRGADGTAAASHNNGALVKASVVADHHNALAAGLIAVQTKVGVNSGGSGAASIDAAQLAGSSSASLTNLTTSGTVTSTGLVSGAAGFRDTRGFTGANGVFKWDEQTPTAVGTFQFTTLPTFGQNLVITFYVRGTAAAPNSALRLTMNNDTGANYDYEQLLYQGAAAAATGETLGAAFMHLAYVSAANATAGYFGSGSIRINNFRSAVGLKQAIAVSMWSESNLTTAAARVMNANGKWRTTATALTRIDMMLDTGNFATGTLFGLYVEM